MENADKILGALRCCGNTDTKKPDCEHCPLLSTRMCVKVMLEGAADLIEQKQPCISELEQQLAKKDAIIKRQQDDHAFWMTEEMIVQKQLKAQLAESQQREQAAVKALEDAEISIESACTLLTPRPDGTISAESARQILFDYGEPHEAMKGEAE